MALGAISGTDATFVADSLLLFSLPFLQAIIFRDTRVSTSTAFFIIYQFLSEYKRYLPYAEKLLILGISGFKTVYTFAAG